MKTEKNILIAFILNLSFSIFELIGGIFTGSVAILSDAIHDIGDAMSIGISYFLEKKSKKQPDETYTYGYARFSVVGSVITTLILLFNSSILLSVFIFLQSSTFKSEPLNTLSKPSNKKQNIFFNPVLLFSVAVFIFIN